MSNEIETQLADAKQPDCTHWNIPGDMAETGISKQPPETAEKLRWIFRYITENRLTQADLARLLNIDGSVISRVFRGTYTDQNNRILPPPAKMLSGIDALRKSELEKARNRKDRVMTPTVSKIWALCHKVAGRDRNGEAVEGEKRLMGFVFGDSHIGKTSAVKWYRDEFNHGSTLYVDLQGISTEAEILREFARALNISPDRTKEKLRASIFKAIAPETLIIVDEFHHITYAIQKKASVRLINALKAIKDKTGCAMVLISTSVGRDEMDSGQEKKLLEQLNRRAVLRLNLPKGIPVYDVRAVCAARGLSFPPAPARPRDGSGQNTDTWARLLKGADVADLAHLRILEDIAYNRGMECLFTNIDDAKRFADRLGEPFGWKHFKAAFKANMATQQEERI